MLTRDTVPGTRYATRVARLVPMYVICICGTYIILFIFCSYLKLCINKIKNKKFLFLTLFFIFKITIIYLVNRDLFEKFV